ncbi:F-box protein SKIP17-like protein [Tanacetum coccineum]
MDTLLESLITVVTDHASIDDSIGRIIESKSTDSEQNDFIQRTIDIGSVLFEAGNRLRRKRASAHNALVWPLPYAITVKVFSMIDTQSVCNVAAACSFFHKGTMDPLCFANIDLVNNAKVNDDVVSTMIQRAGNEIQSIKLGVLPHDKQRGLVKTSILTRSCLSSLTRNVGAPRLRRLHLYNIIHTVNTRLLFSSSVYRSLVDLKIVCFFGYSSRWNNWNLTLESVGRHCPLLEHLIFEISPAERDDGLKYSTSSEFVLNCPNITTLALKGFKVPDSMAHELVEGLHKLKYVDFSTSSSFTGAFLKNLGTIGGGNNLEVMILRDTMHLSKVCIIAFVHFSLL